MRLALLMISVVLLPACATPKLPKVDFLKLPEFRDDYDNIKDYPKVTEAPAEPTDLRKDKAWDNAARDIIKQRDGFSTPVDSEASESDKQIEQRINALIEEAKAYKIDDPK